MFNLENFRAAGKSPPVVPRYSDNHLKIASFILNIGRKLVLASRPDFLTAYFKVWSRLWHSQGVGGVLLEIYLAALDVGSIILKFFVVRMVFIYLGTCK